MLDLVLIRIAHVGGSDGGGTFFLGGLAFWRSHSVSLVGVLPCIAFILARRRSSEVHAFFYAFTLDLERLFLRSSLPDKLPYV